MNKEDRKAFKLLRERIEQASLKFSVEVYRAFADAERVIDGEEPLYPNSGVYVSRDVAKTEMYSNRKKR